MAHTAALLEGSNLPSYRATVELPDVGAPRSRGDLVSALGHELVGSRPVLARRGDGSLELVLVLAAESTVDALAGLLAALTALPELSDPVAITVRATTAAGPENTRSAPELVSVTQAARLLGVTRQAVLRRIDSGALPARKVGSTWTIPRSALPRY